MNFDYKRFLSLFARWTICCVIFVACKNEEPLPDFTGDEYFNAANTKISSKYTVKTYIGNVVGIPEGEYSITQPALNQNVSIKFDSDSSDSILIRFSPNYNYAVNGQKIFSPSVISLNETVCVKMPYILETDKMLFQGNVFTKYFTYYLEGELLKLTEAENILSPKNKLNIRIISQVPKHTYNWNTHLQYIYDIDPYLPDAEYKLNKLGWCLTSENIPTEIEELGMSVKDFFNFIFKTEFLDANKYIGLPKSKRYCNINELIIQQSVRFTPTGDIYAGALVSYLVRTPSISWSGECDYFQRIYYNPIGLRFVEESNNSCLIFGNYDVLLSPLYIRSFYEEKIDLINPQGYQDLLKNIIVAIAPNLQFGIRLNIKRESGNNSNKLLYTFDNDVSKLLLGVLLDLLNKDNHKAMFLENVTYFSPDVDMEKFRKAIDNLPDILNELQNPTLGIELKFN